MIHYLPYFRHTEMALVVYLTASTMIYPVTEKPTSTIAAHKVSMKTPSALSDS